MPATTSWADRIKIAQEGAVKFAPLELGEHNFQVEKASVKVSNSNGNKFITIQAKVIDGPQANAKVFYRLFPNSDKPRPINDVLKFVEALGISTTWLSDDNPSEEEMASAFEGRNFSAEAYVEDDAREDSYTGAPQRSIRNPKPQQGAESAAPVPQGVPNSTFAQMPSSSPTAPAFGQTAPAATESSSPWGNSAPTEPPF